MFCVFLPQTLIMADQQPNNQLNIEISEEVAEGTYANLAIITHSHAEFVMDFVNVMPGTPKSKVKCRIIFTPMHAKRFLRALEDNVNRYEAANGNDCQICIRTFCYFFTYFNIQLVIGLLLCHYIC